MRHRLIIAVQEGEIPAVGAPGAKIASGGASSVLLTEVSYTLVFSCIFLYEPPSLIRRSIIRDNYFEVRKRLGQDAVQASRQEVCPVVGGDDYAEGGQG